MADAIVILKNWREEVVCCQCVFVALDFGEWRQDKSGLYQLKKWGIWAKPPACLVMCLERDCAAAQLSHILSCCTQVTKLHGEKCYSCEGNPRGMWLLWIQRQFGWITSFLPQLLHHAFAAMYVVVLTLHVPLVLVLSETNKSFSENIESLNRLRSSSWK